MKVLAIDCATEHCSAALWLQGAVTERSAPPARGLSEHLLQWVEELLAEARLGLRDLDLLAFGRGPGAFTGVRLAASLVQGLALSTGLPVAPVSTLRTVAARALAEAPRSSRVLVCQDARMNEVYWACFMRQGVDTVALGSERLDAPLAVVLPADVVAPALPGAHADQDLIAAGSGFTAYPQLAQAWRARHGAAVAAEPLVCPPRARDIARLAAGDGLSVAVSAAEALPLYLRNNVASPATPQAL